MKPLLRILLFVCILVAVAGAVVAGYGYATRQIVLRVAVVGTEGDDHALIVALNRWLVANNRRIRLRPLPVEDTQAGLRAVLDRKAELASVRADESLPPGLASTLVLYREAAIVVAAPNAGVTTFQQLRGRAIGALGRTQPRDPLLLALLRAAGAEEARVSPLPPAAVEREVQRRAVQALAYVGPFLASNLSDVRTARPMRGMRDSATVLGLADAEAVAGQDRRYEDFDIPRGAIRSDPALPAETVSTLAVARHLVTRRQLSSPQGARISSELMDAKRGILAETPLAVQIDAPDLEPNAIVPVHAGSSLYFNDEQPTLYETLVEWIYIIPMLLGAIGTGIVWLTHRLDPVHRNTLREVAAELTAIRSQTPKAATREEIDALEERLDAVLDDLGALLGESRVDAASAMPALMLAQSAERRLGEARAAIGEGRHGAAGERAGAMMRGISTI